MAAFQTSQIAFSARMAESDVRWAELDRTIAARMAETERATAARMTELERATAARMAQIDQRFARIESIL